ncbi:xanthine dehydrogenase small subunit [Natronocella acetinitrilica]|uniref:Xanthine dehydrogenase small subunit n=1 Tax=Natronocella acetinitrilica TaxID=414046 RepID=A0AAE3G773_9GAMM|nr:xanthine dehydrogenase small subunit [Natronocella acetinitrilica]MCP1676046.1 xanthine dehydrogenase small subunit [Natronocella acetinitrilica]
MGQAIRFLLGFEEQSLTGVDPNMTVLEWLRTEARRTGTKEGCAEGDCGACTVVLAEPDAHGGLSYTAVNACILFLPVLHGRQLITVEHLRDPDGALHPVQAAMVKAHASQCGFCTPGFVMSLFARFHQGSAEDDLRLEDVLAGNLCRCTGYRPILDAGREVLGAGQREDHFTRREAATLARLQALDDGEPLDLSVHGRRYFAPRSVDALATRLAAEPDATLLAGGTDVGLWVTKQHRVLDNLIDTNRVVELSSIAECDQYLDIGAAVSHGRAMQPIARHYPDFGELLRRFASVQIRNTGTIGGNVANGSPIGDSMPVLIALGAELVLRRADQQRTVPIEAFYLDYRMTNLQPGEFLERVRIPLRPDCVLRCYKISKRFDQDISAACLGILLRLDGGVVQEVRIGVGGMAAIPARALATEQALTGRPWTAEAVEDAADTLEQEFQPLSDMRASADYRRRMMRQLLRRCLLEATQPELVTRVPHYREAAL